MLIIAIKLQYANVYAVYGMCRHYESSSDSYIEYIQKQRYWPLAPRKLWAATDHILRYRLLLLCTKTGTQYSRYVPRRVELEGRVNLGTGCAAHSRMQTVDHSLGCRDGRDHCWDSIRRSHTPLSDVLPRGLRDPRPVYGQNQNASAIICCSGVINASCYWQRGSVI